MSEHRNEMDACARFKRSDHAHTETDAGASKPIVLAEAATGAAV
jgi:hypothetical protein